MKYHLPMCVCVSVSIHVYVYGWVHLCAVQKTASGTITRELSTLIFETGSLTSLEQSRGWSGCSLPPQCWDYEPVLPTLAPPTPNLMGSGDLAQLLIGCRRFVCIVAPKLSVELNLGSEDPHSAGWNKP